jgi:hypothetical protein
MKMDPFPGKMRAIQLGAALGIVLMAAGLRAGAAAAELPPL